MLPMPSTLPRAPIDAAVLRQPLGVGDIVLPDAAGQPGTDFAGVLGASLLQAEASQTATVMPAVPTDPALPTQPANAGVLPDAAVPAAPVRATPRPALPDGKILPPDMPSGTIMPSDPAPHVTLMASGAPGSESVAGEPLDAEAAGSAVSQPQPGLVDLPRPVMPPPLQSGRAVFSRPATTAAPTDMASVAEPSAEPLLAALSATASATTARMAQATEPPAASMASAAAPTASPITAAITPAPLASSSHAPEAPGLSATAPAADLEATLEQMTAMRDVARASRPELTLRHSEFGMINLRVEAAGSAGEWRALLTSRDPGFVPAVHAALAERAVVASSESSSNPGAFSGGRGSDTAPFGQGAGQSPFGSSPGSGQGTSQSHAGPLSTGRRVDEAANAMAADKAHPAGAMPGGLFA